MLICSFQPCNSLGGEGILSLMGVSRIDSIAKYASIPDFQALSSAFSQPVPAFRLPLDIR